MVNKKENILIYNIYLNENFRENIYRYAMRELNSGKYSAQNIVDLC